MIDWGVFRLYHGENSAVLRTMPADSVDSIVTDPPYGLKFMGKKWDYEVPTVEQWAECLRVLKPGGHLVSFAGTRTQHRMAVNIEDAGFEIRDMLAWVYGSGFPKSLDVSKAIDATAGAKREATQWAGWGTALKPAFEPITLARKPFRATVAGNVLAHGTGALNIDACRVGGGVTGSSLFDGGRWPANLIHDGSVALGAASGQLATTSARRQGAVYGTVNTGKLGVDPRGDKGDASRFFYCAKASKSDRNDGLEGLPLKLGGALNMRSDAHAAANGNVPKARENGHPTVKPTDLMRYLVTLVTPPGGLVLDPWMGSGSTGKAAVPAGFRFMGIDRDDWLEVAQRRICFATYGSN